MKPKITSATNKHGVEFKIYDDVSISRYKRNITSLWFINEDTIIANILEEGPGFNFRGIQINIDFLEKTDSNPGIPKEALGSITLHDGTVVYAPCSVIYITVKDGKMIPTCTVFTDLRKRTIPEGPYFGNFEQANEYIETQEIMTMPLLSYSDVERILYKYKELSILFPFEDAKRQVLDTARRKYKLRKNDQ